LILLHQQLLTDRRNKFEQDQSKFNQLGLDKLVGYLAKKRKVEGNIEESAKLQKTIQNEKIRTNVSLGELADTCAKNQPGLL